MNIYEEEYVVRLGKVLSKLEKIKTNLAITTTIDIDVIKEDIEFILHKLGLYEGVKKYYM